MSEEKLKNKLEEIKQSYPDNYEKCVGHYYWHPCEGCKEGHSSFWKTIVESDEWKEWSKIAQYDIPECEECGMMSSAHWKDFVKFISKRTATTLDEGEIAFELFVSMFQKGTDLKTVRKCWENRGEYTRTKEYALRYAKALIANQSKFIKTVDVGKVVHKLELFSKWIMSDDVRSMAHIQKEYRIMFREIIALTTHEDEG